MSTPELGVLLPTMSAPGGALGDPAADARHAEELGFESVWAVDQLVAGTGNPFIESVVALSAAATATTHVRIGFGVMIVALRPVAWAAKSIASLQHVSGGRVLLGVGVGGDRHDRSWPAAGVTATERGRRTDAALRALPGLITGAATPIDPDGAGPTVTLAPGTTMPPVLIGGMSDVALRRVVDHGQAWFLPPVPPAVVAEQAARLAAAAAERGVPTPSITASIMTALPQDPTVPDRDAIVRSMTDVDGMYGIPADIAEQTLAQPDTIELNALLRAYGDAGATRLIFSVAAGDWRRQTELIAHAGRRS